ncbi:MAG: hypothetical protein ABIO36_03490 [Pyrinomonadaceae bacterium]
MTDQTQIIGFECPTEDIAGYIDGELDPAREFELSAHFADCRICSLELNQQKQFLCGLNSRLREETEMELPANFTKLIVANAESTVSGLRRPSEQFNAMFICAGLLLFVLFAMGAEATRVFEGVSTFFDQTLAVGSIFGHLIYSLVVGVIVIVRSVAAQFHIDSAMATMTAAIFFVSLMLISRKALRIRRV